MSNDKQVICLMDMDVIFRQPRDWEGVAPCSHEAADSGMIVHDVDDEPIRIIQLSSIQWTAMLLCWLCTRLEN